VKRKRNQASSALGIVRRKADTRSDNKSKANTDDTRLSEESSCVQDTDTCDKSK